MYNIVRLGIAGEDLNATTQVIEEVDFVTTPKWG